MIDPKEHEKKLLRIYEDEGAKFIRHQGTPGMSQMPYGVEFLEEDNEDEVITIKFKQPKRVVETDESNNDTKEILSETNQSSEIKQDQ